MDMVSGFAGGELMGLALFTVILLAGLVLLRAVSRLTAALFRLGCLAVAVLVLGAGLLIYVA
jgi:hypothetical protein